MDLTEALKQAEVISAETAGTAFGLTDDMLPGIDRFKASDKLFLYKGDLTIEGNLSLDDRTPWPAHVVGLIVDGDLRVTGDLINADGDYGPTVAVLGEFEATNGLFGGATFFVRGDANFNGVVVAHYNHGCVTISGQCQAQVIISDDHATNLTTSSPYWNSHDSQFIGMPLSEYLHEEVVFDDPVERDIDDQYLGLAELPEIEALVRRVVARQPLLRAKGDKRRRRTAKQWLDVVREHPPAVQHVPAEYRNEEIHRTAVERDGLTLQFVDPGLRSKALCEAAIAQNANARNYVPENLSLGELSLPEITDLIEQGDISDVPEHLLTVAICKEALLSGDALLREIPPALRTVEVCAAAFDLVNMFVLADIPVEIRKEVCDRVGFQLVKGQDWADEMPIAKRIGH